jgi:ketosteroid isomerase-like protein
MRRLVGALAVCAIPTIAGASTEDDRQAVSTLDIEFQEAVKRNDADTMARILHVDCVLVTGDGRIYTRDDMLNEARTQEMIYEIQDEDFGTQTVRVWGDTAIVTARLWIKGVSNGKAFEKRVWFSDTYVRTTRGWRYFFGQSSLSLPL